MYLRDASRWRGVVYVHSSFIAYIVYVYLEIIVRTHHNHTVQVIRAHNLSLNAGHVRVTYSVTASAS